MALSTGCYTYGMITNDEYLPVVQLDNKFSCYCLNSVSFLQPSGTCYASCSNGDACGSRNLNVPFVPIVISVSVYQAVAPAPVSAPTTVEAPAKPIIIPSPQAPQPSAQESSRPEVQAQTTKGPATSDLPAQQVEAPNSSESASKAVVSQSNSNAGIKANETRAAPAALDASDKRAQETSSKSSTPVAPSNSAPQSDQQQSPLMPFAIVGTLILLLCLVGVGICVFRARATRPSDDDDAECSLSRSSSTQTNIFKEKGFSVDLKAAMIPILRYNSKSSRSLQRSDHSATLVGSPNRPAFNKCHTVMSSTSSVLRLNSYYQKRELA
ncbi:hypothetical protein HDU81_007386 [Chytriomyces hyalinus]|nr:hypothetical protein HDU81_007386 [Chytriomyces hyalinus]